MRPFAALAILFALTVAVTQGQLPAKGVRLEQYTWQGAEKLLTADAVVVIPIGAALKEHGPHLRLRNDLTLAEYFVDRVTQASSVVVTPPLTYHFYPAFLEYPGSTSLSLDTARDLTTQIVRNLAQHGPRRFYALNTGISTIRALEPAAEALAREGILLRFTNFGAAADAAAARVRQQELGSHADEIETSAMLYIDPGSVDMKLAVKDVSPRSTPMRLTRVRGAQGTYSPSGVWGDATLATRQKGEVVVEAIVSAMLADIEALRSAPLPSPRAEEPRAGPARAVLNDLPEPREGAVSECPPGREKDIKRLEAVFNASWKNRDADRLGGLWTYEGDLIHGDGTVEKGAKTISLNRAEQFKTREYRHARHYIVMSTIRCLTTSIAIVDGRWDLQDVTDKAGKALPRADGFFTMVLRGEHIEAYRYNTRPAAPSGPTLLTRPGWPDKDEPE
jgi:creatinine amidohydrolase